MFMPQIWGHVASYHIRKSTLSQTKELFVLPKRVIGVYTQNFDAAWHDWSFHFAAEFYIVI
jgi:hypothetical protein